jgi:hypothetical protein
MELNAAELLYLGKVPVLVVRLNIGDLHLIPTSRIGEPPCQQQRSKRKRRPKPEKSATRTSRGRVDVHLIEGRSAFLRSSKYRRYETLGPDVVIIASALYFPVLSIHGRAHT